MVKKLNNDNDKKFSNIQRLAKIGIWELDIESGVLEWSDEVYRIFEVDETEFNGTIESFFSNIHPDDVELVKNAYDNSLKTRVPYNINHKLLLKDGNIKFVNERCESFYDENGKAIKSVGTVQDITSQKKFKIEQGVREKYLSGLYAAKKKLSNSNKNSYQDFVDILGETANADRTYIFLNYTDDANRIFAKQIIEYCKEGVTEEIDNQLLKKFDYQSFPSLSKRMYDGGVYSKIVKDLPKEEKGLLEEQDIKSILIIPIYFNNTFLGYIGFDNCTNEIEWSQIEIDFLKNAAVDFGQYLERKKIEEKIQNENNRFQAVMDTMDAGVYVADMDNYELLFSNKKFNNDFGNKIGEKCYSVIQKGKSSKCEFCTNHLLLDKKGHPNKPHIWEFKNTITNRWYQCRDQAIKWSNGKLVRMEITIDITEKKLAEKKLVEEKIFSDKIIETSNAIIVGLDKNHRIKIFNKGAEKITGYKRDEVIEKDWFKIFFPKTMYEEMNTVWEDSWGERDSSNINPIISKNGNEKIISWQNTGFCEDESIDNHLLISIGEDITEKVESENALKISENRFKILSEASNEAIFISENGKCIDANSTASIMSGYSYDEMIGMFATDFIAEESKELVKTNILSNYKDFYDAIAIRKNGKKFQAEIKGKSYYNNGKIFRITTLKDISERKNNELKLKLEREQLELVLKSANIGWWDWNILSGEESYNNTLPKLLGYDLKEVSPHIDWWADKIHPDDLNQVNRDLKDHFDGKTKIYKNNHRLRSKKEGWKWFADYGKVVNRDSKGNPTRMIGTLRDINNEYLSEKYLRESEEKFRLLTETMTDVIVKVSLKGRVTFCSTSITQFGGYNPQDEIGCFISKYFSDRNEYLLAIKQITKLVVSKKNGMFAFLFKPKNKAPFYVENSYMPVLKNNKVIEIQMVLRDISERKNNEKQIKEYAESQELLLREVNHRVKNNLYSIVGMLQKEKSKISKSNKPINEEFIDDIINRIDSLSAIHSLLSASKWKPLQLSKLLQDLTTYFFDNISPSNLETVEEIEVTEKVDSTQAQHIAMVYNEILTNSTKYSQVNIDELVIGIDIKSDKENIFIRISDNGVGFPQKILDGNYSDTGIGFNLIFGIVEDSLGGSVSIKNNNGAVYNIEIAKKIQ